MKSPTYILLLLTTLLVGCAQDKIYLDDPLDNQLTAALSKAAQNGDPTFFQLPDATNFSAIPQDPANPLTIQKVALGKLLFYETGLATAANYSEGMGTYSCATCHVPEAGFRPGAVQGVADGGVGFGRNGEARGMLSVYEEWELDVQSVRPLSVLNVAYVKNTTWNGRFGSEGVNKGMEHIWQTDHDLVVNEQGFAALESQNIEGLTLHRMDITEEVLDDFGYRPYFDAAFKGWPVPERYGKRAAAFAISAYLRTLLSNQAPFQDYLKGDKKRLTGQEKRGALLFFGKAKCYHCHKEKNLGANEFYALGVKDLYENATTFNTTASDPMNLGRANFSTESADQYKFKIPQLYNLGDAPFYFHGSSHRDLRSVVSYFNAAKPENPNVPESQIARQFTPLGLSESEMDDLTAFLANGLRDPNLSRYVPVNLPSGNCFPNNDAVSRVDLGCQ
ncbi:MAG: cytochrome c peroxidase [Bacteroidota bacterium]